MGNLVWDPKDKMDYEANPKPRSLTLGLHGSEDALGSAFDPSISGCFQGDFGL